jgi:hypothetical protein
MRIKTLALVSVFCLTLVYGEGPDAGMRLDQILGVCDYNTDCAKWGEGQCAFEGNGAPKKASIEESRDTCSVTCGNGAVVTKVCDPADTVAGEWLDSLPSFSPSVSCNARFYRAGAADDMLITQIDLTSLGTITTDDASYKSLGYDGALYLAQCILGTCDDLVDCATAADAACAELGHVQAMSSELTADGGCSYVCQGGLNGVFVCADMPEPESPPAPSVVVDAPDPIPQNRPLCSVVDPDCGNPDDR